MTSKGLRSFVDQYYELFDYNTLIRRNAGHENVIYDVYLPNIKQFLNTEFTWPAGRPSHIPMNIKYVRDLPREDLVVAVEYLGYVLGIHSRGGCIRFGELLDIAMNSC